MEKENLIITQVCKNKFEPVIELIGEMLKSHSTPILIGIDGMCASGKTTLGFYLQNEFDCNLFHMDDFLLQKHQRAHERLSEIGGNVDYERFKKEVLVPILNKQSIKYCPYNCDLGTNCISEMSNTLQYLKGRASRLIQDEFLELNIRV